MLGTPLLLGPKGDQVNSEIFARRVLNDYLHGTGGSLAFQEHEDALAALVVVAWQESCRYDQAKTTMKFSSYLYDVLYNRVTDWYRGRWGRSEKKRALTRVARDEERVFDPSDVRDFTGQVISNVALGL